MRFKFCGDMDCPDWVLCEIVELSKQSVVKVKLLSILVAKHIIHAESLDPVKVSKHSGSTDLETNKALTAALMFILEQAARYNTESARLYEELQQLGFPSEHATQIAKCFADYQSKLQQEMEHRGLRLSRVTSPLQWSLDLVLLDSYHIQNPSPITVSIECQLWSMLNTKPKSHSQSWDSGVPAGGDFQTLQITMSAEQLRQLVHQVGLLKKKMEILLDLEKSVSASAKS